MHAVTKKRRRKKQNILVRSFVVIAIDSVFVRPSTFVIVVISVSSSMRCAKRWTLPTTSILSFCTGINYFSAMAWRSHGKNNLDMVSQLKCKLTIPLVFQIIITLHFI